ncbi:hypothetical protein Syun_025284 [Stephania yunnanensis]|uniref:Uncharacterized protein n=1 Tax=Stephania yunnanensis TaxID=152371 RepID=A0AAP0ERW9_9MAGN
MAGAAAARRLAGVAARGCRERQMCGGGWGRDGRGGREGEGAKRDPRSRFAIQDILTSLDATRGELSLEVTLLLRLLASGKVTRGEGWCEKKHRTLCEKLGDSISADIEANREVTADGKWRLGRHVSRNCTRRELALKFDEFVEDTADMHPEVNRGSMKTMAEVCRCMRLRSLLVTTRFLCNAYFKTNPLESDHYM